MRQLGFFDLEDSYKGLDKAKDPLVFLNKYIPFEDFQPILVKAWRVSKKRRKTNAGRKPWDEVLMFKLLILQQLYNLSDDQTEYQLRDRLSFMRFLGLTVGDAVPDAKTIWLYREKLGKSKAARYLFEHFADYLTQNGFRAKSGQIIDASIISVPKQRNKRAENEQIKEGKTPEEWADEPCKMAQKDTDARWTKKHGKSYFGYKNHIGVDKRFKFVRKYAVTPANRHDSQVFRDVIDPMNQSSIVWADSAYRSKSCEEWLSDRMYLSQVHFKGNRNKPLNKQEIKQNKQRSKSRARVEHIFGFQENSMGRKMVRTIGLARAKVKIGMMNLAYNMSRLVQFRRRRAIICT